MLVAIPGVLNADQLGQCRQALENAPWADGRATAGFQAAAVKQNEQLPETDPTSQRLGSLILKALERVPLFISAALPSRIAAPLFSRYLPGQTYGKHVDGAIRTVTGKGHHVRTDLSATIFLCAPEDYDGGELIIEDHFGIHTVKLPAGHLALYPASSAHYVKPVTSGARIASVFWVQSLVRANDCRSLLFDLDRSIQELRGTQSPAVLRLTAVYHNLLRQWAET